MDFKTIIGKIKMGAGSMLAFLTAFFAAIIAHARKAGANTLPTPPNPPAPTPTPVPTLPPPPAPGMYVAETWRPYLTYQIAKIAKNLYIPIQFAVNWVQKESGGNPCAIGEPGAKGPDGFPKEQGISQLWNPDDMTALGVKSGEFRAYCDKNGGQVCTRALTQNEMLRQAEVTIRKIMECVTSANSTLMGNKAQGLVGWRPNGEDYWKLVKCVHGLPGLAHGMTYVTLALKRPPSNWAEFKDQVMNHVKLDSGTERHRKKYADIFANAEFTANGAGVEVA